MKLNILRKGFSLTELLIVLVIIAVLFAAMAPIMTKRQQANSMANESVWSFVTNSKDAFYDPGVEGLSSSAYFGMNPTDMAENYKPYSKVYIRAKAGQNHIQFRYGDGYGSLTGLFSMDNNSNTILSTKPTDSTNFADRGSNNTIAGLNAYTTWKSVSSSVGIGGSSLSEPKDAWSPIIAVGANTEQYAGGGYNIAIGTNTVRGKNGIGRTVAVGGRVLSIDSSGGVENVFVGYGVATAGFHSEDAKNNTIISSNMYGTTAHNNTIIGYGAYDANFGTAHGMTVVGKDACNSIQMSSGYTNQGPKTCIGYNTANTQGVSGVGTPNWSDDKFDHVFIGGSPYGFNGQAVLEVHNMSGGAGNGIWKPKITPTVVLNSHLVVRGNVYFPLVTTGYVTPHMYSAPTPNIKSQQNGYDRCGKKCWNRKRYWARPQCKLLGDILGALIGAVTAALSIPTGGIGGLIFVTVWGAGVGGGIGHLFNGKDYKRPVEPPTASMMVFGDGSSLLPSCMTSTAYPTSTYCPNLQLSDIRLKENITENTDALDKIMYVLPYNYSYKNDQTKTANVGVMAQDLQKYLPDSVFEGKDGYLGIQWDGMFYATINSIKSLDKTIENLVADVSNIEDEATVVEKEQKAAKKRIDELNKRINKLENK